MSGSNKEDDQLFQDASTLLMFANVAAKQQQEELNRRITPPPQHPFAPPIYVPPYGAPEAVSHRYVASTNYPVHQDASPYNTTSPKQIVDNKNKDKGTLVNNEEKQENRYTDVAHYESENNPSQGDTSIREQDSKPHETEEPKPVRNETESHHSRDNSSNSAGDFKDDSQSSNVSNRDKNFKYSPGPASVVLTRGINIESGKRNNNNAMIAAAALAAAADIPLPLIKKTEAEQSNQDTSNETETNSTNEINASKPLIKSEQSDTGNLSEKNEQAAIPADQEAQTISSEQNISAHENVVISAPEIAADSSNLDIPPLEKYKVKPDSGLIGCICGIEDDDGFTIQCDICYRWQHCVCMGFSTGEEIPDEYTCYFCDKNKWGKFDPTECRHKTLKRLEGESSHSYDQNVSDSITSSKRKHSSDTRMDEKKKKKLYKPVDQSSEKVERRKKEKEEFVPNKQEIIRNYENDLLNDGMFAEFYESEYYKISDNEYKLKSLHDSLKQAGSIFYDKYSSLGGQNVKTDIEVVGLDKLNSTKFCHIIRSSPNSKNSTSINKKDENDMLSIQVKYYNDNHKQKFSGVQRLGLFISSPNITDKQLVIPKGTPIIEYLGEIDMFTNYKNSPISQYHIWGTPKPKIVKTTLKLSEDDRRDVVLNSRFSGNESRYIRKSCPLASNCEIKVIYVPQLNDFKYIVVTSKDITLSKEVDSEELRFEWEWDSDHPIKKLYKVSNQDDIESLKFDQLSDKEKSFLISCVDNLLNFSDCGCCSASSNAINNECAVFKVKKATSYLLRSVRKMANISNVNLSKPKDELIDIKKPTRYLPWSQRLQQRDRSLIMQFFQTDESSIPSFPIEDDKEKPSSDVVSEKGPEKSTNDITSKPFCRIQYIQKILKHGLDVSAVNPDEVEKSTFTENKPDEKSNEIESTGIPLLPEVLIKIQKEVNGEMQEKDDSNSKPDESVNKGDATKEQPKPVSSFLQDKAKSTDAEAPNTPETARVPVVKKLSFADYKKKMK
ncbi:Piso0_005898 [Millerozyma farinosa CBS 7064]|uniref:Piso0_005898 protein n=1 Tax=Pichia sorbitophila (strain ATCC MYA-4447 / BCRC 22081 / CBS 7064 / NBRC 10061 / NRRL Y-12695) TaxID=559304 RepID=G8Y089_PICSO|nr:Piso0_005898 [Millerozyma farinosa CBS 7064]